MTQQEKFDKTYKQSPTFLKFVDDHALERINTLTSGAHMLISVALTMEQESEIILEKYGLRVHEIKQATTNLQKAFDRYMDELRPYYSPKMEQNFMVEFDKALKDLYVYLGMDINWKPGDTDDYKYIGFQNAFLHCLNQRGHKTYRFIGRSNKGDLWMSTKPSGKAVKLPSKWFGDLKKGEIRKVEINPLIKY